MTAVADPAMPWLEDALNLECAQAMLRTSLTLPTLDPPSLKVRGVRLVRHLPGRRCLIEYCVDVQHRGLQRRVCLLGKIRAKGLNRETIRVMTALQDAGFASHSADGISIPELAGVIPDWRMWLAVKVEGTLVSEYLAGTERTRFAERAADVAQKIHLSGVAGAIRHTIENENAILDAALSKAADARPDLASRIRDVAAACGEMAGDAPTGRFAGIHRDFYGDQIVVAGDRLYILDLDQFCEGDPALDIGNFLAHMTEQSIRLRGDPFAFDDARTSLLERAVRNGVGRTTILIYDLLTLARHLWISTRIPDRGHITPAILAECERRLERSLVETR